MESTRRSEGRSGKMRRMDKASQKAMYGG
jgi:hypothetical protein